MILRAMQLAQTRRRSISLSVRIEGKADFPKPNKWEKLIMGDLSLNGSLVVRKSLLAP